MPNLRVENKQTYGGCKLPVGDTDANRMQVVTRETEQMDPSGSWVRDAMRKLLKTIDKVGHKNNMN